MRLLLAILALVGLLLSPVAASAAARECMHGDAPMMMQMAPGVAMSGDHHCCPDDAKPKPTPAKHDSKACAAACAVMGAVAVALPEAQPAVLAPVGHALHEPAPPQAVHAYAPPGLERPPRTIA